MWYTANKLVKTGKVIKVNKEYPIPLIIIL